MADAQTGLEAILRETVPQGWLADTTRMIRDSYADGVDLVGSLYDDPEAHDSLSQHRRWIIEQNWRAISKRHNVDATAELNKTKSNYHTRATIGRIVITQSMISAPWKLPRPTAYRNAYSPEYPLVFPLLQPFIDYRPPQPENPIYAAIIHGPDRRNPAQAQFILLRFMAMNAARKKLTYIGRAIDLLREFGDAGDIGNGVHVIAPKSMPPAVGLGLKLIKSQENKEAK